jgi:DNA-directed RNA polymerase subunit RPC12/RpoP
MKTEVDLAQLAQAVSVAILQFAQPQPTITQKEIDDLVDEEQPKIIAATKKKRGRPKKVKTEDETDVELARDALKEADQAKPWEQVKKDLGFTAPTKLEAHEAAKQREGGGTYMKRVPFKKKPRVNQWVDNLSIAQADLYNKEGKKLVYPPHTEPRPPQEEYEYKCDICNRKFKAFPSYVAGSVDGESQPQIRCFDCNSRR